jgi:hypothetical protein
MKAKDAVNATATVLSRMNASDRAAVARLLTAPGRVEAITEMAIFDGVKAIATRSVNTHIALAKVGELRDLWKTLITD